MIKPSKILSITILTSIILITGRSPPLPAQGQMKDYSLFTFSHLAQRQNKLVQEVDTIGITVRDMEEAYQQLGQFNVTHVSTAPQKLPDYIEAFYFRDPDGNTLELIYFPSDKGDPRWQMPTEHLFLGIDHTAIAIFNTEISRQFYQDLLGLIENCSTLRIKVRS